MDAAPSWTMQDWMRRRPAPATTPASFRKTDRAERGASLRNPFRDADRVQAPAAERRGTDSGSGRLGCARHPVQNDAGWVTAGLPSLRRASSENAIPSLPKESPEGGDDAAGRRVDDEADGRRRGRSVLHPTRWAGDRSPWPAVHPHSGAARRNPQSGVVTGPERRHVRARPCASLRSPGSAARPSRRTRGTRKASGASARRRPARSSGGPCPGSGPPRPPRGFRGCHALRPPRPCRAGPPRGRSRWRRSAEPR